MINIYFQCEQKVALNFQIIALYYMSDFQDECVRHNAKLVANYLISDTCLNALKWPHRPTYTL